MTIKIKVSCGGSSIANADHSNPMITKFLPGRGNLWRGCEFYWNDISIKEADYWIIVNDPKLAEETCLIPNENIIFFATEPPLKRYDVYPEFINQFYRLYLSHKIDHPRIYNSRPAMNWWVDAGHPIKIPENIDNFDNWKGDGFGYDDFKNMKEYNKTKLISVFCSNKLWSKSHEERFIFCQKLKDHFKDKLDWFGSGVQDIKNKWDGIAPYKYHIALENSNYPDYWTEKLMDCYMAGAYPIYSGAPNIYDYFDRNSLTVIDKKYPKLAFAIIEKLIDENTYEKSQNKIIEAKDLILDKYNVLNMMAEIAIKDAGSHNKKQLITIKNINFFAKKNSYIFVKVKRGFFQKMLRSFLKRIHKPKLFIIDNYLLIKFKIGLLK